MIEHQVQILDWPVVTLGCCDVDMLGGYLAQDAAIESSETNGHRAEFVGVFHCPDDIRRVAAR
jgi:hypothetical protein